MKDSALLEWLLTRRPSAEVASATSRSQWLFETLKQAILQSDLQPGQALPPSRLVAKELTMARNSVIAAYQRLTDEGFAHALLGSGTYVSDTVPDARVWKPKTTSLSHQMGPAKLSRRAQNLLARAGASDIQVGAFVPGIPDLDEFPRLIWQRLMSRHWRHLSVSMLGYGGREGYPPLKRALAQYLRLARGVVCEDEQILVTQGTHQALDLCARLLADVGDEVWIEDPCYWGARSVFMAAGLRLTPIPVDEDGLVPPIRPVPSSRLPRLAFVTPSHQYPSGMVMSLARRRLLLEIARRDSFYIVEDDYDSEFRYQGAPLPCLQGLDVHGRTIYIGSFSKVLYPGLRLGFMVLPSPLVEPFRRLQSELYRGGSLTLQATLAEFIDQGHYAAHVRRMRKIYGARQALLVDELNKQLGSRATIMGADAGLHLTVALHALDDRAVCEAAWHQGVAARALSTYFDQPASALSGLVLGYGGVDEAEVSSAVQRLAMAVEEVCAEQKSSGAGQSA